MKWNVFREERKRIKNNEFLKYNTSNEENNVN